MKCEICHLAEAETVIRRKIKGKQTELFVCRSCAANNNSHVHSHSPDAADHAQSKSEAEAGGQSAKKPVPVLDMLLGAAFEIIDHTIKDQQRPPVDPACPACGLTRNEWRKNVRMGCPACYQAFGRELAPLIFQDQRASQHVGKTPQKYRLGAEKARLERELQAAVEAQDFEKAIELRNSLAALGGGKSSSKGDQS
ncbi:MAG: UvrB/UvrC motif-containing protein [Kiritimatiellae bacterium]|nr:UvrB/UvrC motif-containing protein [Kiritimatiellia bacterium]